MVFPEKSFAAAWGVDHNQVEEIFHSCTCRSITVGDHHIRHFVGNLGAAHPRQFSYERRFVVALLRWSSGPHRRRLRVRRRLV